MRTLLVTSKSQAGYNLAAPLGLYQLRHHVKTRGFDCDLLDRDLYEPDQALADIHAGRYDVVGMSVAHDVMAEDLDMLWRFRDAAEASGHPVLFVAGGQEAAMNSRQWLDLGIDLIFLGFAEHPFEGFLRRLQALKAAGVAAPALAELTLGLDGATFIGPEGETVRNPAPVLTAEMFQQLFYHQILTIDVPFQDYWDILREKSADTTLGASQFIIENARIYTSSHCPRQCGFCSSQSFLPESQGTNAKITMLTPEQVLDLIRMYVDRYGARGFLFSDDDFPVGNKPGLDRLRRLCELIIADKASGRLPEDLHFACQARILDFVERNIGGPRRPMRDLLKLMYQAGFRSVGLGVETFVERLYKAPSVNKGGLTLETCRMVLEAMLEEGVIPQINQILGLPEYTADELAFTMEVAVDFMIRGCDVAVSRHLLALPGAPIYGAGLYDLEVETWTHPRTGTTVEIAAYFPPKDPAVRHVLDNLWRAETEERERIAGRRGWEGKIFHKRIIGLTSLLAAAKLLGRRDLVRRFQTVLDAVLDKMDLEEALESGRAVETTAA